MALKALQDLRESAGLPPTPPRPQPPRPQPTTRSAAQPKNESRPDRITVHESPFREKNDLSANESSTPAVVKPESVVKAESSEKKPLPRSDKNEHEDEETSLEDYLLNKNEKRPHEKVVTAKEVPAKVVSAVSPKMTAINQ